MAPAARSVPELEGRGQKSAPKRAKPARHAASAHVAPVLALLISLTALALLSIASVSFGSRSVDLADVWAGVWGHADTIAQAAVAMRVPRTALAALVGGALAVSGLGMQAVTRNPLADPGIFGISAGASLAVASGMVFLGLNDQWAYMGAAVLGAGVTASFVYAIGSIGPSGPSPLKLALAGAATAAAVSSLINIVLLPRVDVLQNYQFWQIGGVGGATWERVNTSAPVLAIAVLAAFLLSRRMNSLALGDDLATGLGVNVTRSRAYVSLTSVVLAGVATAVAGPIGFVGLIIPHFCRLLLGPDHRWLVPLSAVTGAALLVGADTLGRIIARPQEVQVGIVTALIGAPFFIWIVRRQKVREL